MFTYFHCYLPETWEAEIKAGLVNDRSGIRFTESLDIEEPLKFNSLAGKDGALYDLIRNTRMPFYIDRLQGGCYIEHYPYDMVLVDAYREMLGDGFYGFQLHEWMSNYRNDIRKLVDHHCPAWNKDAITATIRKAFPFPHLFLESLDADEMEAFGYPEDYESFLKKAITLFSDRQTYAGGDLLPCDSYYLAYPIELRAGAKRLMPEIGAQTPDTRIQVAYARGMTKAKHRSFGTYYEPWGGEPFSACSYQRDGKNEWNIRTGADFPFETKGANGGSSRSMQRRMHLYSYMAGASFMSEEWGMCNTFYDWRDFELSPYGEIKREFIRFTEKYPDIGQPVTPIAVVLPEDLSVLEGVRKTDDTYCSYPIGGSFAKKVRSVRSALYALFCESGPMLGSETTSLVNGVIPDALDIVGEDVVDGDRYDYLVDLTGSSAFARTYRNKCCLVEEVRGLLDEALPCTVCGNSLKQFTRNGEGTYFMLLTNNSGVVRSCKEGETFIEEATEPQSVTVKGDRRLIALEGTALTRDEHGIYHTDIPAGGYFFAKIV